MGYVNGLHDLGSPEARARKQAARAQADADAAKAAADKVAQDKIDASDPIAAMFGWSVPKNLGGIPTWMLMAGGLLATMFIFGGGKRR
jgi:hypothetical protein